MPSFSDVADPRGLNTSNSGRAGSVPKLHSFSGSRHALPAHLDATTYAAKSAPCVLPLSNFSAPSTTPGSASRLHSPGQAVHALCAACRSEACKATFKCARCGVLYCSARCQRKDWQAGHGDICGVDASMSAPSGRSDSPVQDHRLEGGSPKGLRNELLGSIMCVTHPCLWTHVCLVLSRQAFVRPFSILIEVLELSSDLGLGKWWYLISEDGHLAERREDPLYRGEKVAQCDVIFLTPPVLWSERVSTKRLNEVVQKILDMKPQWSLWPLCCCCSWPLCCCSCFRPQHDDGVQSPQMLCTGVPVLFWREFMSDTPLVDLSVTACPSSLLDSALRSGFKPLPAKSLF